MRKFPKAFTRRKSTANAFEDLENTTPIEGSFKVFDRNDRSDTGSKSFDGGVKLAKPTSASGKLPQSPAVEDNMFENIGNHRYGICAALDSLDMGRVGLICLQSQWRIVLEYSIFNNNRQVLSIKRCFNDCILHRFTGQKRRVEVTA